MDHPFFEAYMEYTRQTESPRNYHRWCAIAAASAMLSRNIWFTHGHFNIYPNNFCMLIGDPGTRKSTAIKLAKKLLGLAGYTEFAPSKSSKEKFLSDLAGITDPGDTAKGSILEDNLWGGDESTVKEVCIMADEFNEFAGTGNIEFYDILGTLWDWDDATRPYEHRYKNSQIRIFQPTVTLIAGNTPENFARAFPPEIIGTGFMSRLLLIHGERTGIKIAFPTTPPSSATTNLTQLLSGMRRYTGPLSLSEGARSLLGDIYSNWREVDDSRFLSYSNRRFSHLLKLITTVCGSASLREITTEAVIYANTILSAAELAMPRALGEFGKSKNSDVANKIMDYMIRVTKPATPKDLWQVVRKDLDKLDSMQQILSGLVAGERLQLIGGPNGGYLPRQKVKPVPIHVNWNLLTPEEQENV